MKRRKLWELDMSIKGTLQSTLVLKRINKIAKVSSEFVKPVNNDDNDNDDYDNNNNDDNSNILTVDNPRGGSSCPLFQGQIEIWKCWFLWRDLEKSPWIKDKKQQQTQLISDPVFGN